MENLAEAPNLSNTEQFTPERNLMNVINRERPLETALLSQIQGFKGALERSFLKIPGVGRIFAALNFIQFPENSHCKEIGVKLKICQEAGRDHRKCVSYCILLSMIAFEMPTKDI